MDNEGELMTFNVLSGRSARKGIGEMEEEAGERESKHSITLTHVFIPPSRVIISGYLELPIDCPWLSAK